MVFKKNNKGQAAIEFLMTYGWMLLVVLIVGALIFSFVDFGSLLPNKLQLSNDFKADASQILASKNADGNYIRALISYVGTKSGTVNISRVRFLRDDGVYCDSSTEAQGGYVHMKNIATNTIISTENTTSVGDGLEAANKAGDTLNFINGQQAVLTFGCPSDTVLIEGDVVEGDIEIPVTNTKTKFEIKSKGSLRATIQ